MVSTTTSPVGIRAHSRARWLLIGSAVAALGLYLIPGGRWIAYPLFLLSTVAHEMGHGLAALLVGGSFHRFEMYADGSGVAMWSGHAGRLGRAFVAAGGLVGPAVAAGLAMVAGRSPRGARAMLGLFGVGLGVACLLVVRSVFGFFFVGAVALAALGAALRLSDGACQLALFFVAAQLSLSVFSRADYLFTPVAETATGAMPSDVQQIAEALWLPYWVWGALCGLFAVATVAGGLAAVWRLPGRPSIAPGQSPFR